jgi:hypothetical protein
MTDVKRNLCDGLFSLRDIIGPWKKTESPVIADGAFHLGQSRYLIITSFPVAVFRREKIMFLAS